MKILISALLILLTGCMTVEKAKSFLEKKDALAEICAEEFPDDTITTTTIDTSLVFDTLYLPELVVDTVTKDSIVYVRTTQTKYIRTTYNILTTKTVRDSAALQAKTDAINKQRDQIVKLETQKAAQKDKIGSQRKQLWILYAIITVLLGYIFRKQLAKLALPVTRFIPNIKP